MKKIYRISENWREADVAFLASLGIERQVKTLDPISIEEGETFSKIRDYITKRNSYFFEDYHFEYTRKEIEESSYCAIRRYHWCGYPEHDEITYDTHWCPKCHYEKIQIEDCRISKISKQKLWGFFAWTHDVLFSEESFYKDVFEPLGIKCRTVRTTGGKIIDGLVQLVIPEINEDVDFSFFKIKRTCPECGKTKYCALPTKAFFPLHKNPLPHLYLTKEYFGDGWESNRYIYISTELALKLIENKALKYEWLIPCIPNHSDEIL